MTSFQIAGQQNIFGLVRDILRRKRRRTPQLTSDTAQQIQEIIKNAKAYLEPGLEAKNRSPSNPNRRFYMWGYPTLDRKKRPTAQITIGHFSKTEKAAFDAFLSTGTVDPDAMHEFTRLRHLQGLSVNITILANAKATYHPTYKLLDVGRNRKTEPYTDLLCLERAIEQRFKMVDEAEHGVSRRPPANAPAAQPLGKHYG